MNGEIGIIKHYSISLLPYFPKKMQIDEGIMKIERLFGKEVDADEFLRYTLKKKEFVLVAIRLKLGLVI